MPPSTKDYIERIANGTIGASVLRNQGVPGIIAAAREFLPELDLARFVGNQTKFAGELEEQTRLLKQAFPKEARENFGAARKALNLFLEECYYHRIVCAEYKLGNIERFLEVPLDSQVATCLLKKAQQAGKKLPKWQGIKGLSELDNTAYQGFATEVMAKKGEGFFRIHLDVLVWRRNPNYEED